MTKKEEWTLLSAFTPLIDFQSVQRVWLCPDENWPHWVEVSGLGPWSEEIQRIRASGQFRRAVDVLTEQAVQVIGPGALHYPDWCWHLPKPPKFLCLRGQPAWHSHPALSVVGSRRPTRETLNWLNEHLLYFLKHRNALVVSGGARGVDQKAHELSLLAGRPTLCFLPVGFPHVYPDSLRELESEILKSGGGFISGLAPFTELFKGHFAARNLLIAAAGQLVFVAEARRRSGSMVTAREASSLDRAIATLPHSPMHAAALGSLDLLVNGAILLRDSLDLMAAFDLSQNRVVEARPPSGSLLV